MRFLLAFLLLLNALIVCGQTLKDSSLVRQYNAKAKTSLEQQKIDSAQLQAQKGLDMAQKIKFKRGELESLLTLNAVFDARNKSAESLPYLVRAKAIAEQLNDLRSLSIVLSNIGYIHTLKGNYDLARANYLLALNVREQLKDKAAMSATLNAIGNIHNSRSEFNQALEYYNKALSLRQEINDKTGLSTIYNNLGNLHYALKDYKRAEASYEESIRLKRELKDLTGLGGALVNMASTQRMLGSKDKMIALQLEALQLLEDGKNEKYLTSLLNNIAVYYTEQKDFGLALHYYMKALHRRGTQEDVRGKVVTYNGISNMYVKRQMPDSAGYFVSLSIESAKKSGLKKEERDAYRLMADVQFIKGDFKAALENYQSYSKINDTILNEERTKQFALAQTQFESVQKEKENELLKKDNLLKENELERKRLAQEQLLLQTEQERQKFIVLSTESKAKEAELRSAKLAEDAQKLENELLKQKEKNQTEELFRKGNALDLQKNLNWITLGFAGLLVGIIFLIWRSRNMQKRGNQKLLQKNEEILNKSVEIIAQKEEISAKNKLIQEKNENLTASINYAKRIQTAILPTMDTLSLFLADFAIFWKPRDIVSGDFYWFGHVESPERNLVIAIIDCTGHGVPGAFMSMIANDLLNTIINEKHLQQPNAILDDLDKEIRKVLRQDETHNQDGMDIALIKILPEKASFIFAGAKISVLYAFDTESNVQFEILEANRSSIGGLKMPSDKNGYKQQVIDYKDKSLTFFVATDGYSDQFGGQADTPEKFKTKRFRKLLTNHAQLALEEQKELWIQALDSWQGEQKQTDDITIFGGKVSNKT